LVWRIEEIWFGENVDVKGRLRKDIGVWTLYGFFRE
jgi:hypothetical protein